MPVRISPNWLVVQGAPFAQPKSKSPQLPKLPKGESEPVRIHLIHECCVQHSVHDALTDAPPED
jgi:hypothetical protein